MDVVRIAVVGAGVIGRQHVEWARRETTAQIVGIADPNPAARDFAAHASVPYFADYRELLDRTRPDGAIVATPNALHLPVGLACIERGIAMLVEKPIAETLEAAAALDAAAMAAGVPMLVGHYRRHNPVLVTAREIVRSGRLGRLAAVNCSLMMLKPDDYFDISWRRVAGGGPLLINLIHDIDQLRFICGEITTVQAIASSHMRELAVEDTAAVIMRFECGALATATVSDAVPSPWSWDMTAGENAFFPRHPENAYMIAGSEASLALPGMTLWRYTGERGWGHRLAREQVDVTPADPFVAQLRHFCRVVRRVEEPIVSGADATRTLAVIEAIAEAARTGRPVSLEPLYETRAGAAPMAAEVS